MGNTLLLNNIMATHMVLLKDVFFENTKKL